MPKLKIHNIITESPPAESQLFALPAETLQERRQARKDSLESRVAEAKKIAETTDEQVLIWCNYNDESEALKKAINGSYEVKGSDTEEHKENGMIGFSENTISKLISKPSICGFGMNWQNCHKMIFCGLSDSYEQFYQAIRRCWRFGQKNEVDVYVITSEAEANILNNIKAKQDRHDLMSAEMLKTINAITKERLYNMRFEHSHYKPQEELKLPAWGIR